GKVMHLAGKAVNEEQGRSGSFIEIVDARAVDVDETSARRQLLLHLLCRPSRKQNKASQNEADECGAGAHNPGDHCFAPCPSQSQYVTGIRRSARAAYLASRRTGMRGLRFSRPRKSDDKSRFRRYPNEEAHAGSVRIPARSCYLSCT